MAVETDRSRVKGGILAIPSKTLESFSSWSPIDISEYLGVIRAGLIERLQAYKFQTMPGYTIEHKVPIIITIIIIVIATSSSSYYIICILLISQRRSHITRLV